MSAAGWGEAAKQGASIGGTIFSQLSANRQAKKNRAFQKMMFKHRYRFAVNDMRKAGLNPILAAPGGGGSPSGSMPTQFDLGATINTGRKVQLARDKYEERERALMDAQRYNQTEQANTATALKEKFQVEKMLAAQQLPGARIEAEIDQTRYGAWIRYGNRAIPITNTASGLISQIPKNPFRKPKKGATLQRSSRSQTHKTDSGSSTTKQEYTY